MADVVLEGVTKRYVSGNRPKSGERPTDNATDSAAAFGFGVEELNLRIADREFLVLVGPSGCGKSTTLRLIAGLETLTAGRILIGGRVVNSLPPAERDIAMVFQNYALYPHMTVAGNLAFGLRLRYGGGISARLVRRLVNPRRAAELAAQRRGIEQRVRQAAERLGIAHLLDRKPHELSGGERQRVALGRAIVRDPAAFLFDEPLSNLDAKLRQQMRSELKQLHAGLGATTIYVTHDQVEAMTLGQRVAVMDRGRLQQIGTPEEIYDRPANLFVAQFFGSTPINLLPGELVSSGTEVEFVSGPCRLNMGPLKLGPERSRQCRQWPRQVTLAFRGEDLHPYSETEGLAGGWSEQSARESWRFPPLPVRQVDNWGDARVVELALEDENFGEPRFGEPRRASDSLACDSMGGVGAGGFVGELKTGGRGAEASLPGRLVAKLAGDVPGKLVPGKLQCGEPLALELAVNKSHWFDSATHRRLEWLP
jgi:multiple sugar transport system ATP-binding protein